MSTPDDTGPNTDVAAKRIAGGAAHAVGHGTSPLIRLVSRASTTSVRFPISASTRSCGGCTACCEGWLSTKVLGQELKPGSSCRYRGAGGCTIYSERPVDPCRNFICGWLVPGNPFPEDFRPDKLKVIFVPKRWRNRIAYIVAAAGREIDDAFVQSVIVFSRKTGIPFVCMKQDGEYAIGPAAFRQEMLEKGKR